MKSAAFQSIKKLNKKDLNGKRVIVRFDFNVPIENGEITDDYRLIQSLPTLEYLRERGARILAISHRGDSEDSLAPVADYLARHLPTYFAPDLAALADINCLPSGELILFENLRRHKGEEKNDLKFAKELAQFGDLYVNEAFSVSHREHASVVALPKLLPAYAGLQFAREVAELSRAFEPRHPFLFILGGAKFATKIPLLKKFHRSADVVVLGGALVHVLYKKRGYQIGRSLVDLKVSGIEQFTRSKKILIPHDVVVENEHGYYVKAADSVGKSDIIYDAGPDTVSEIKKLATEAKFILWNGPLGNFEMGYDRATLEVAKAIAKSEAYSVIGGGDTIAAIARLDNLKKFNFVSTAGGAMLDFLATGTLPGLKALGSAKQGSRSKRGLK